MQLSNSIFSLSALVIDSLQMEISAFQETLSSHALYITLLQYMHPLVCAC